MFNYKNTWNILQYNFIQEKKYLLGHVFINKTIIISDIGEKREEEEGYNYSTKKLG